MINRLFQQLNSCTDIQLNGQIAGNTINQTNERLNSYTDS